MNGTLTPEQKRKAWPVYEQIVTEGIETFVEVGGALLWIKESEFYLESFATFEDYCKAKWGFSVRFAQMQIKAAKTVELIKGDANNCSPLPSSEAQVRPLTTLPEEERAEAWQEAVAESNGTPTAKDVEAVVERRKPTAAKPGPSADEVTEIEDELDKWQDFIDDRWSNGVLTKGPFMKVVYQAVTYAKAKK